MKNCLHIYYGDGKGKTTAAIGQAMRCCGRDMKVLVTTFLKDGDSGEFLIKTPFEYIKPDFPSKFWMDLNCEERNSVICEARRVIDNIVLKCHEYDLIVLDEFLDGISLGLIPEPYALEMLNKMIENCEVILTGHCYIESIFKLGDYITEMKKIKHPYDLGRECRTGIEK